MVDLAINLKATDNASPALKGLSNTVKGIGAAIGASQIAGGLKGITGELAKLTQGAAEDAASQSRLKQAVENTGASYGSYADQLGKVIDKGMKLGFTDDQSRDALALLTAQTGDASEATKRYALAQDLARGANIDVVTASKLLGKVTNENVNVLSRYGIAAKEGMTETELFGLVQEKFGGQAEAFGKSVAGAAERNRIAMDEMRESMGAKLLPVLSAVHTGFQALPGPLQTGVALFGVMGPQLGQIAFGLGAMLPALSGLVPALATVRTAMMAMSATMLAPPLGIVLALAAVGVAAYVFRDEIVGAIGAAADFVVPKVLWLRDKLVGAFNTVLGFVKSNWPIIAALVAGPFAPLVLLATDAFGIRSALVGAFNSIVDFIGGLAGSAFDKAKNFGDSIYQGIKGGLNAAIGAINTLIRAWNDLEFKVDGPFGIGSVSVGTPDLREITPLRSGHPYIPYDNYPALLHKGERVMSAADNRNYSRATENTQNDNRRNVNFYGPVTIGANDWDGLVGGRP